MAAGLLPHQRRPLLSYNSLLRFLTAGNRKCKAFNELYTPKFRYSTSAFKYIFVRASDAPAPYLGLAAT